MITQNSPYLSTYSQIIGKYQYTGIPVQLRYSESNVADHLLEPAFRTRISDMTSVYPEIRIEAVTWLGVWSTGGKEVDYIYRLALQDPDLQVRAAARIALTKIYTRLTSTSDQLF